MQFIIQFEENSLILYQTWNSPHWEIRYLRPDKLHLRIFLKFGNNLKIIEKVQYKYTKEVNSLPKIILELFHLFSILPGSEYSSSGHGSIAQMSENGLD